MDSWNAMAAQSPLAKADWSGLFQEQVPTTGWWKNTPSPFTYSAINSKPGSMDYHPGSTGQAYSPESSLTQDIIQSDIDSWLAREHPELFDFNSQVPTSGVGVGKVAQSNGFGQFSRDPSVYREMQASADKYGVPVNFLQAIIAAESSGDWQGNNRFWYGRPQSGPLLPYIGVFENTAVSRTGMTAQQFRGLAGNRAGQIDLLAAVLRSQYDDIRTRNPTYGWLNVASYHYSGIPDPRQQIWSDEGGNGTNLAYMNKIEGWWKTLDQQAGNEWGNYTPTGVGTGVASPNTSAWAPVNRWDQMITSASGKYGVPANLIKAIMRYESNGDPNASSPQLATGLMQIMPLHVNGNRAVLWDPATNIDIGARILKDNYQRYGTWEMAAKAYIGLSGVDAHGTGNVKYWNDVSTLWDELNAAGSGVFGAAPMDRGSTTQVQAIWGARDFPITQEHGRTAFSATNPNGMYNYSTGVLGYIGHPGIDVGMPIGTPLYSPVHGTVIVDGGSGSYFNTPGTRSQSGLGELRIKLDNGDELILGHNSRSLVRVGQRVTPGMQVALSGYPSAPHLHLEYRRPNSRFSSGWEALDPRQALGGVYTGAHQSAPTGLGYTQPMTFRNLMLAGASGQAIPSGPIHNSLGGGASSWNAWMRGAMQGNAGYSPKVMDYDYFSSLPSSRPVAPGVGPTV